jgi:hypothetical protein
MKGIILSGDTGSRLYPLTKVNNKHLLPVYDTDTVGCHLATLAGSRCRVNDYNNIINIFPRSPTPAKMPPAQGLDKHLTMKNSNRRDRRGTRRMGKCV